MPSITYRDAGVDVEKADLFVEKIKKIARKTHGPEVLGGIGGFGALFALDLGTMRHPLLVSGTDGVGTKVLIAIAFKKLEHLGTDLVAMCVNDILTLGAKPLFFLDYLAVGKLDVNQAVTLVESIARACDESGCALIGGETAEMPGLYQNHDFDLAGFAVGIVDRDEVIDGKDIQSGDLVIGLPSTGLHSNGYSLARRVLLGTSENIDDRAAALLHENVAEIGNRTLGDILLSPTRLYPKLILKLMKTIKIKGLAHITGGGLPGNLPRILPPETSVKISKSSWLAPKIFTLIAHRGGVQEEEMFSTFNMGIGMAVVVNRNDADSFMTLLRQENETAHVIGEIVAQKSSESQFELVS